MASKDKIIEMISKMSALTATDSGAFQGEISNASAKIAELMDKYSISWAEIHAKEAEKQTKEFTEAFTNKASDFTFKKVQKWHWALARLIARVTHTRHFVSAFNQMSFFGTTDNAEIASCLYLLWLTNINVMSDKALKEHKKAMLKEFGDHKNFWSSLEVGLQPKNYRPSWIQGCIDGMNASVSTEEEHRTEETANAIVLFKHDLAKQYEVFKGNHFRNVKTKNILVNSNAGYSAGREVGSSINITSKPIGSGRKLLGG